VLSFTCILFYYHVSAFSKKQTNKQKNKKTLSLTSERGAFLNYITFIWELVIINRFARKILLPKKCSFAICTCPIPYGHQIFKCLSQYFPTTSHHLRRKFNNKKKENSFVFIFPLHMFSKTLKLRKWKKVGIKTKEKTDFLCIHFVIQILKARKQ